jgi:hypothetical protein
MCTVSHSSRENTMRNLSIIIIIFLVVWNLSCTQGDAAGSSSGADKGAKENNSSTVGNIIPPDYFLPLPSTYLSEIDTPHQPPLSFIVSIVDKTLPPPLTPMEWGIAYNNGNQKLTCFGNRFHPGQAYSGVLDPGYKDDFIEMIQYIQAHTEFFTYDEYQGAPPGDINSPEQYNIAVGVQIEGYDYVLNEHANTYVIVKYVPGMSLEIMQPVVDIMRNVFLPEVLNHPYPAQ